MTRVYEFAKRVNLPSADLVKLLQDAGFETKSHMSVLGEAELAFLSARFEHENNSSESKNTVQKQDKKLKKSLLEETDIVAAPEELAPVVIDKKLVEDDDLAVALDLDFTGDDPEQDVVVDKLRRVLRTDGIVRKNKFQKNKNNKNNHHAVKNSNHQVEVKAPAQIDLAVPYQVSDIAKILTWSPAQAVSFFVKRGKFLSMNDVVPREVLSSFAGDLGLEVVSNSLEKNNSKTVAQVGAESLKPHHKMTVRSPVVVILGHVDHGKTTLIDHISKTNVANKELGGITQTVRVCYANSSLGKVIIIDTPGHEAFASMRKVGAKITDIAVIIVAADDGVMPQTVESIAIAKEMGVQIVVAINKIDKDGAAANLDKIKQQLAKYDVLVEEWGGPVVCVPISAKTGKGVDELLEMIMLQAELLDLRSTEDARAKAFVLESFVERGLGPCAVVLQKEGVLRVGDSFVAGSSVGKVKAIIDLSGKRVSLLKPYSTGKIVGLSEVCRTGEFLEYCPTNEVAGLKKTLAESRADELFVSAKDKSSLAAYGNSDAINVVLKADGFGVLEALEKIITSLGDRDPKFRGMVRIVASSVGNIYEKDVITAFDNDAVVLGMNVSLEKNASDFARQNKVVVKVDGIVYRLVEYIEKTVIDRLKTMKELKPLGKGFVKKVFDIKGRGVVAGCEITEGSFAEKAVVFCMRNGEKVGQGKISSLQQNKKMFKELAAGQDCGFICQGFSDWKENDRVVCFSEVSLAD